MTAHSDTTVFIETDDGHSLALRDVAPTAGHAAAAVLCLHGLFSDSRFFLNRAGQGPAGVLLEHGYRLFLGELRGHGRSRWPKGGGRRWGWGFDEYVRHDLPALVRAARARHQGPLYILCHSMSGYAMLASLGLCASLRADVAGVCLVASAVNDYSEYPLVKRVAFTLSDWITRVTGRFPARLLRVGVSDEPHLLFRQFRQWARDGGFASRDGVVDYWRALREVDLPVWAAVGSADRFHASVPRGRRLLAELGTATSEVEFVELGRCSGFSRDYGHVDAVRGEAARNEVWPRLVQWLSHRTAGQAG